MPVEFSALIHHGTFRDIFERRHEKTPTLSDTNRAVQLQKMARGLESSGIVLCSENKGADQLRGHREADLLLFFAYAKCWFSHIVAHLILFLGDDTLSIWRFAVQTKQLT